MLVLLTSLFLGPLFSLIQNSSLIFVYGVKPNLVFSLIVAYAILEKDHLRRAAIVLLANVGLIFYPVLAWQNLYWIVVMFLAMVLVDYLPWHFAVNAILSLLISIVLISLDGIQLSVLITEFLYSSLFLYLVYLSLSWIKSKQGLRYA